ncbi:hypothetical protein [Gimibacter soli]|uniref:Uncharacterized protein n=1 Tax=Gimibacter soli TaxID=3024400 RepID=A0AAE9XTS1_9PROT|nr:hypothetical protein [Gimibacter soli]WCL54215.1 hypothetical protein PH603_00390 [Gimibacter soli]
MNKLMTLTPALKAAHRLDRDLATLTAVFGSTRRSAPRRETATAGMGLLGARS